MFKTSLNFGLQYFAYFYIYDLNVDLMSIGGWCWWGASCEITGKSILFKKEYVILTYYFGESQEKLTMYYI